MKNYLQLLQKILAEGHEKTDRTGTGTYSLFGEQLRFDLSQGFPLLTTKKLHFHSIRTELLWMLRGDTNVCWLQQHGVSIWDEWANENGELGPVYGSQWRDWTSAYPTEFGSTELQHTDQLKELIEGLRSNPDGRRHIIKAWNPGELRDMKLPPCHCLMQFYVQCNSAKPDTLSCHMYQRSADVFLGVPFNIAQYALLTNLLAMELSMNPGELIISFGDVHLYKNHVEQAYTQLARSPRVLPSLGVHFKQGAILYKKAYDPHPKAFSYQPEDIMVCNYDPHPGIKAPVAV